MMSQQNRSIPTTEAHEPPRFVHTPGDQVGEAWKSRLRDRAYGSGISAPRSLHRFTSSPYIQLILRYARLKPGSLVLEPGCGSGKFGFAMASEGHRVIWLDYLAGVLQDVRVAAGYLHHRRSDRFSGLTQGSLERLPFPRDTFDLVLNEGVVEHWLVFAERQAVLEEMVRVARVGGVVAVWVPNGAHPLIHRWQTDLAAFRTAPAMTYYDARKLRLELGRAGLHDVYTDGIYAWRSWTRLPAWDRLYPVGAALDHLVPLPRTLRTRWGINLLGIGRKRHGVRSTQPSTVLISDSRSRG